MSPEAVINTVAPHTGAWIETNDLKQSTNPKYVAPHTGAWIETGYEGMRQPSRYVAPHTGAWIETYLYASHMHFSPSLPIRERGLKHANNYVNAGLIVSLPIRERGLKPCVPPLRCAFPHVAPHTGAWIETFSISDWETEGWVAPHTGAWIET